MNFLAALKTILLSIGIMVASYATQTGSYLGAIFLSDASDKPGLSTASTPTKRIKILLNDAGNVPVISPSPSISTEPDRPPIASTSPAATTSSLPSPLLVTPTPAPETSPIVITPIPTPILSPTPNPTPSATPAPEPIPSPDFAVGTLLIGNNPSIVKAGLPVTFSVFVRDEAGTTIKDRYMTFAVNAKAMPATTDATGNAYLSLATDPLFTGALAINVQLGGRQTTFKVTMADARPDLSVSVFAFTTEGYHVRLRNALGEYIAGWQVTTYLRDGSQQAVKFTNELGVAEFPLPEREDGGHIYACAVVKDIGKECTEW